MRTCKQTLRRAATFALLALSAAPTAPAGETTQASGAWRQASSEFAWSFPRDHFSHPGFRTEWWYFTGHLESEIEPRRRFGYQFTIFRVGLTSVPLELESDWGTRALLMAHASISDEEGRRHRFSELLYREAPFLAAFGAPPGPRIAWSVPPAGSARPWSLHWEEGTFAYEMQDLRERIGFRLRLRPSKPLVFQGPKGLSRKDAAHSAASLYYSYTRLETRGTLELDGSSWPVRGESWMDREFSSAHLAPGQVGWDWFSLQLDDGRELMLYLLRDASQAVDYARGTLVDREGGTTYLAPADWRLRATADWRSPESGIRYPSAWELELPALDLQLRLRPTLAGQENRSRVAGGLSYWEGAVTVTDREGRPLGRGYVELTGYGEGNRPPV